MTSYFKDDPDLNLRCVSAEVSPNDEIYAAWLIQKKFALQVWCQYWLAIDYKYRQMMNVSRKKVHVSTCLKLRTNLLSDMNELVKLHTALVVSPFMSDLAFQSFQSVSSILIRAFDNVVIPVSATLNGIID